MSKLETIDSVVAWAKSVQCTAQMADEMISLIDLTSLGGSEQPGDIEALCKQAVEADVAAVCIYAKHLAQARRLLDGSRVKLATVVSFPDGGDDILQAVEEARFAD